VEVAGFGVLLAEFMTSSAYSRLRSVSETPQPQKCRYFGLEPQSLADTLQFFAGVLSPPTESF